MKKSPQPSVPVSSLVVSTLASPTRPTLYQSLTSYAVAPSATTGIVLWLAILLPLGKGCDGKINYPLEPSTGGSWDWPAIVPFVFGLMIAMGVLAVAFVRRPWAVRAYAVAVSFAGLLNAVFWSMIAAEQWKKLTDILYVLPYIAGTALFLWLPLRRRDWLRWIATVQSLNLMTICVMLLMATVFYREHYSGSVIGWICILALVAFQFVFFLRVRRDTVDLKAPLEPWQISLRWLLLLMVLLPILYIYHRALQKLIG